jgi:uncharacterized protein YyaL (SSP411 family)
VQAKTENRLGREKSPYLLQHAKNPVDWYPWGEEAFAKAGAEDRPVFLSIGYSTCHWCHVMERESFENEAIAALLNEHFVPIKVDREERPDIDQVYMQAVQILTGQGGWPLSVFLTPDGLPFWGGTYFPPDNRFGRPGFATVLTALSDAWRTRRAELLESADKLKSIIHDHSRLARPETGREPDPAILALGVQQFASRFDPAQGGFGPAPKFPRSHALSFLLGAHARSGDPAILRMVEVTLDHMARGGIHDHLGGGFHRYSTDGQWLVPHFEKMLYDQALLARTYLEAYQVTGKPAYAEVARGIFTYVLREMTAPEGGFYSAEDADSEGEEGKFYVWTPEEVREVLGPEESAFFAGIYDVTSSGNFEGGSSILNLKRRLPDVAAEHRMEPAALAARLEGARAKLLAARSKRVRPHLDDKVLTDWNGLMIGALALGARILGEPAYRAAAERAASFVLATLRRGDGRGDGRLLKRYRAGEASIPGYLDDYAFLSWGLLDLYGATFDPKYLESARDLAREMVKLFWDAEGGGFFFTGSDGPQLLVRTQEIYDAATPSGNAIAALVLLRLGDLIADPELSRYGRETVAAFAPALEASPLSFPQMLIALDFAVGPTAEVVLAGAPESSEFRAKAAALNRRFLPRVVVAARPPGDAGRRMVALAPYLAAHEPLDGKATAFVCRNYACALPARDTETMLGQLS